MFNPLTTRLIDVTMVNTTTYSRKHREAAQHTSSTRKRPRANLGSEPTRKKAKKVDICAFYFQITLSSSLLQSNDPMLPFQTPHPTLEAQSQVYKLPSSQPQYSPGPLSPLPIAPVASKNLKENSQQRTTTSVGGTPWSKHSYVRIGGLFL